MKKAVTLFFLVACGILTIPAQPNGGFEDWHTEYSFQTLDNWQTLNILTMLTPPNPISAYKATGLDKHSGNCALKIKTIFISNNPAPNFIDDSVGLVFTGIVNYSPPLQKLGFPYTGRPEKLEFWSKYIPVGNDSGGAFVYLRKWNGNTQDTIAFGKTYLAATGTFTLFQTHLTYYSNALPDSAVIIFGSSLKLGHTRVGSTIYIDDVAFTGWVGIDEQNTYREKVKIFPNPVRDNVTISAMIDDAENIQIVDVSGNLFGTYEIRNYKSCINTSSFAGGFYICVILDKKDKILFQDKFSVIR